MTAQLIAIAVCLATRRILGDVLAWWGMVTREEGDLDE